MESKKNPYILIIKTQGENSLSFLEKSFKNLTFLFSIDPLSERIFFLIAGVTFTYESLSGFFRGTRTDLT